jgi:geranylgeranyl diphosphate synthase type I
MISGKTAAILGFAARGGAIVGGADATLAERFADFGEALGIGFQIRDDVLGIWGADAETGKTRGDDIRRRKQSLPILLLRARASEEDIARLDVLYSGDEINDDGLFEVFTMLDRYQIQDEAAAHIEAAHQRAIDAFEAIERFGKTTASAELSILVHRLQGRQS